MKIEQFVMAYKVEQDRIRAMIPKGFESLRPVLRINAELRSGEAYIEFNTPVAAYGKKGWLNIASWKTPETDIKVTRSGAAVSFDTGFLMITYTGVGIEGNCPAERDNDGCFFIGETTELVPSETITANKEFCDCEFAWKFAEGDACGVNIGGKTLPAIPMDAVKNYEHQKLTAEAAAHIECEQMLGQYKVIFERNELDGK